MDELTGDEGTKEQQAKPARRSIASALALSTTTSSSATVGLFTVRRRGDRARTRCGMVRAVGFDLVRQRARRPGRRHGRLVLRRPCHRRHPVRADDAACSGWSPSTSWCRPPWWCVRCSRPPTTPTRRSSRSTIPEAGRRHLLFLYIAITVTPGTAVVAGDREASTMYLHVLHGDRVDDVIEHVEVLAALVAQRLPGARTRPRSDHDSGRGGAVRRPGVRSRRCHLPVGDGPVDGRSGHRARPAARVV